MVISNFFSFQSIIDSVDGINGASFAVCIIAAIVLGILISLAFMYRNFAGQSILLTLTVLPAIVSVIIMLVGDNLGAGIALAGAFSLMKFRSQPGTAREITSLLLACGVGFACGAGYILIAILLTFSVLLIQTVFLLLNIGGTSFATRRLKITIPETLDYAGVFDKTLRKYTSRYTLIDTRTVEMGSFYRLTYDITLNDPKTEKTMIDELRTLNGNMEIVCGRPTDNKNEL